MRFLLLALLAGGLALSSATEEAGPAWDQETVSWRVLLHEASGSAFRFPPQFYPARYDQLSVFDRQAQWQAMLRRKAAKEVGIHHLWQAQQAPDAALPEVLAQMLGREITVIEAGDTWHGEAVDWLRASAGGSRCLLLRAPAGYAGVSCDAGVNAGLAQKVLASFELCRRLDGHWQTARAAHAAQRRLQTADGRYVHRLRAPRARDAEAPLVVESRYYVVSGTARATQLSELAEHLDRIRAALEVLLPLAHPQTVKFRVSVADGEEEFRDSMRRRSSVAPELQAKRTVQGYFSGGEHGIYTYAERTRGTIGSLELRANHEAVHQYLHLLGAARPPQWLDEGLAVAFEAASTRSGEVRIRLPNLRARYLRDYYQQHGGPLVPLADYLSGRSYRLHMQQYAELGSLCAVLLARPASRQQLARWWQLQQANLEVLLAGFDGATTEARIEHWRRELLAAVASGAVAEALPVAIHAGD